MRLAAEAAGKALMQNLSEYAIMEVLPTLLAGMELKKLWQTKVRHGLVPLAVALQLADSCLARSVNRGHVSWLEVLQTILGGRCLGLPVLWSHSCQVSCDGLYLSCWVCR